MVACASGSIIFFGLLFYYYYILSVSIVCAGPGDRFGLTRNNYTIPTIVRYYWPARGGVDAWDARAAGPGDCEIVAGTRNAKRIEFCKSKRGRRVCYYQTILYLLVLYRPTGDVCVRLHIITFNT